MTYKTMELCLEASSFFLMLAFTIKGVVLLFKGTPKSIKLKLRIS